MIINLLAVTFQRKLADIFAPAINSSLRRISKVIMLVKGSMNNFEIEEF